MHPAQGFSAFGGIPGSSQATLEADRLRANIPQVSSAEDRIRPANGPDKGALFLDSAGNVVTAQPLCAGYFGRTPEELVGLNIHALLKPSFGREITEALTKGRDAGKLSLSVSALRKDGSEFATQLTFKFLPNNPGFCWIMFVQAPAGGDGGSHQDIMNFQVNSKSTPDREIQPITATTETATESAQPEAEGVPAIQPAPPAGTLSETERLAVKLEAARAECERLAGIKFEADTAAEKRLRQVQSEFGHRIMRLEEDLLTERRNNERLKQQLSKPAAPPEKTSAEFQELQQKLQALESETASLRQEREQLQGRLESSQTAQQQVQSEIATLTARLEESSRALADLEKERAGAKLSEERAEELKAQVEKLRNIAEQAQLRARENAAESREWEQKAAELQKTIDEFNGAGGQSAQRLKELELQLEGANENLATTKADLEKQNSARQRLEEENHNLTEANAKAQADLVKERDTNNISRQESEKLAAQLKRVEHAAEAAELRAREYAAQLKESEKKAADQKKAFDDLNRTRVNEQYTTWQSAQRLKELEQQLKLATQAMAARKAETEEQKSARQKVESENRSLTEAIAKAKAELEKERDTNNISRQETEKLAAQLNKLQHAAEEAELRARESAAQSKEWEKKAADQKKANDELNRIRVDELRASAQSAQRLKALELQLKGANDNLAASTAGLEKQNSARKKLEMEYRNLRAANAQTKAELEKAVEVAQSASAQSLQRLKEIELQLEGANENLATTRADLKKQDSARQELEAENRKLAEGNSIIKADLDKERDTNNISRQETEKLTAQLKKLQYATEQAGLRARENAAQSKEWEKKVADQKKAIDELNRVRANEHSASVQSAQRLKELELQLKGANDNLAASRADIEKQNSARQRLETEIRNLRATNAQTKADLEKTIAELTRGRDAAQSANAQSLQRLKELELQLKGANDNLAASQAETREQDSARQQLEAENRKLAEANAKTRTDLEQECEANKLSRQTAQKLSTELKKSQRAVQQAEARLRKSAAQCSDRDKKIAELKKINSRLEKESAKELRHLKQLLTEAQRQLEQQSTEGKAQISKLRAALELGESQRKKLENELLRLREIVAQHERGAMMESLRQGLRQRVEDVRQSASGLLENQLPDKQKRLAESILGHALFLQIFLSTNGKNAGEAFPT